MLDLNQEINLALLNPKIKAWLADFGGSALALSPADFGKLIAPARNCLPLLNGTLIDIGQCAQLAR
jgi:hypothetical protein